MSLARTFSVALVGIEGRLVEVEANIGQGLPGTVIVGLPDTAVQQARDRVKAAVTNSRESWPDRKITIGLSPASLPKRGSTFDLAMAAAVLAAAGAVPAERVAHCMFYGELGLDGRVRGVPGVLPAVLGAATLLRVGWSRMSMWCPSVRSAS
jgi:magnesium chelatase family protein